MDKKNNKVGLLLKVELKKMLKVKFYKPIKIQIPNSCTSHIYVIDIKNTSQLILNKFGMLLTQVYLKMVQANGHSLKDSNNLQ